jgi:two-component system nitrate/nitrite response regulator NarL
VLALKLARLDGIRVCTRVTAEAPGTKTMLLSAEVSSDLVFRALAAGVRAILSRQAHATELLGALRSVAAGEVVIPRSLHAGLAQEIRARGAEAPPALSLRELEVLQWIAAGASVPEIGRRLHLSEGTVKTHIQRLYTKLDVSERAAAVAVAMRHGIIE